MADSFPGAPGGRTLPDPPTDEPKLESWGEIAAYLRREIRTVQRWETYQRLPVRRLQIGKLGTVYAYRSELDRWYKERQKRDKHKHLVRWAIGAGSLLVLSLAAYVAIVRPSLPI